MNIYNDYTYNFEYDDVPAKEQELENLQAAVAAACNYSGNYTSSSSGSPSSNSMGAFETSIGTLSISNPCRPPPPAATTSFPLPDQADDNYHSQLDAPDFRRVYSAGDLDSVNSYMARRRSQRRAESPLSTSNENSLIIQGCILTATKYNPQEKKERIDRYRYKRNQRNFHKKIQYTCRKTLADSRPRVKGRFVRNDVEVASTTAAAAATVEDGINYNTSSGSWYEGGDRYSSSDYEHVVNNIINVGEDDNCEENSWINLLDCSHYF